MGGDEIGGELPGLVVIWEADLLEESGDVGGSGLVVGDLVLVDG